MKKKQIKGIKRVMYIADTSNSGADGMFPMMKPVPGGGMPGVSVTLL